MTLKEAIEAAHKAQVACRGEDYDYELWDARERAERNLRNILIESLGNPR